MNVKTISRMLLAFSAVMIYMAMTMDTTVSTGYGYVHNIGLQSEQTNMLILGGIGFIAGIVLFSGSLYLLCYVKYKEMSLNWLGAITPFGGAAFIAGWVMLFWAVLKRN